MFLSLGNHEFDEGVIGLVPFIRNLSTPVLAANLNLENVPELQNEPNLKKSVILKVNQVKIGIIGYLTPETKYLAPKNDVDYEDEVTAIREEVANLQSQGVNILIALGHSGFLKDLKIAKEVEDIDLVIGGHSNTFLWNSNTTEERPEIPEGPYPTMVEQASGRIVPVVQAYAYTKYMGRLHLRFNSEGEINEIDGTPLLLDQQIPRDSEVLQIVKKYQESIGRIFNEEVGTSQVLLDGSQCRLRECNLGSIISDAIVDFTKQNHISSQDFNTCYIAIVQGGRIRSSIDNPQKPFKLLRGDWITVLPFSDTLAILTVNGTSLRQVLEHSVDTWRTVDSTGQFLQFSGMKVVYDLAKPPGSRVVSAKGVTADCEDAQAIIDNSKEYKLIMPSFLADGGDGFKMFERIDRETVSFNEVTCVLEYLKTHDPIKNKVSGRLILQNESLVSSPLDTKIRKSKSFKSSASTAVSGYYLSCLVIIYVCFCLPNIP